MQKVIFVEGYNSGNPELDELNALLADGWEVESVTGLPNNAHYPVFAFVLESDI